MKYHFKVHKEGDGFWAECVELDGCITQGDSKKELFKNMQEALNLYLEEPEDSTFLAPFPRKNLKITRSIIEVPVDPEVAFGFMVRYHRIKKGLTQKKASLELGMKNLYSYQRLEKRCNATLEMIGKLIKIFPKFSLDRIFK
ncbi:MAG: type II toxin-antitoxin system HicB family antitoxin [Candidatus Thorarchaeota archaeon]